jgi:hypothetical protein
VTLRCQRKILSIGLKAPIQPNAGKRGIKRIVRDQLGHFLLYPIHIFRLNSNAGQSLAASMMHSHDLGGFKVSPP